MKEIIEKIEECMFHVDKTIWESDYEGYIITTNKQQIKLGIQEGQSCCECYGYITSEDDLSSYIGAELIDVVITDKLLVSTNLSAVHQGDTMFVTIETNKGSFQFVAYNDHNGYYGHEAIVISEQLNYSECL